MRVKHLIRELHRCDPEAEVLTEGCDCYGDSYALDTSEAGEVLIQRSAMCDTAYQNSDDTPRPLDRVVIEQAPQVTKR